MFICEINACKCWICYFQSQANLISQDVLGWGYLAWQTEAGNAGPRVLENINELGGVQMIVCSERCLIALAKSGKLYSLVYNSESKVRYRIRNRLIVRRGWLVFTKWYDTVGWLSYSANYKALLKISQQHYMKLIQLTV